MSGCGHRQSTPSPGFSPHLAILLCLHFLLLPTVSTLNFRLCNCARAPSLLPHFPAESRSTGVAVTISNGSNDRTPSIPVARWLILTVRGIKRVWFAQRVPRHCTEGISLSDLPEGETRGTDHTQWGRCAMYWWFHFTPKDRFLVGIL